MWKVIVGSLTAVFIMMGQAWAIPTDVSTVGVGVLDCSGSCQAGTSLVVSRSAPGDTGNPDGARFRDEYLFHLTGPVDMAGKGFGINVVPGFNVEGLNFALFGPGMNHSGSFLVPDGSGSLQFTPFLFQGLTLPAYSLVVRGEIPQAFSGGLYLLEADFTQAAVSQVPLPAAMFLFVSALIGMFPLMQMRKRLPTA